MIQDIYRYVRPFMREDMLEKSINDINGTLMATAKQMNLTDRVSAAKKKPMKSLTTDEICTLLRQREGGPIVLAIGIMIVGEEPLISADAGSGDLLRLVMEYEWNSWLATMPYGTDPWITISIAQSTLAGMREDLTELDALFAKLDADSKAG